MSLSAVCLACSSLVATTPSFNLGGPTVGIACEYDALPEIGHACGHNLIAAAGFAAGVAAKEFLGQWRLPGKVTNSDLPQITAT